MITLIARTLSFSHMTYLTFIILKIKLAFLDVGRATEVSVHAVNFL